MKPGYKTTEFWKHAAVTAAGLLVASGVLGPEVCEASWCSPVLSALGFVTAAWSTDRYSSKRTAAKIEETKAGKDPS